MPEPDLFLKGFKVAEGDTYGDYKISSIAMGEEVKRRYDEYLYPTTITLMWEGNGVPQKSDFDAMIKEFKAHVKEDRTIYTRYHNPYKCVFIWPKQSALESKKVDGYIKVDLIFTGHSKRIR